MTTQTFVLPYYRSALQIPRRDLVLATADGLRLRITVVERDDPSAQALYLTGGVGGPACSLVVWRGERPGWRWDYGAPYSTTLPGETLWTSAGVIADAAGSFDIIIPPGAMADWPRRCWFSVHLAWSGASSHETLATGVLQLAPVPAVPFITELPLTTDDLQPLTTD